MSVRGTGHAFFHHRGANAGHVGDFDFSRTRSKLLHFGYLLCSIVWIGRVGPTARGRQGTRAGARGRASDSIDVVSEDTDGTDRSCCHATLGRLPFRQRVETESSWVSGFATSGRLLQDEFVKRQLGCSARRAPVCSTSWKERARWLRRQLRVARQRAPAEIRDRRRHRSRRRLRSGFLAGVHDELRLRSASLWRLGGGGVTPGARSLRGIGSLARCLALGNKHGYRSALVESERALARSTSVRARTRPDCAGRSRRVERVRGRRNPDRRTRTEPPAVSPAASARPSAGNQRPFSRFHRLLTLES